MVKSCSSFSAFVWKGIWTLFSGPVPPSVSKPIVQNQKKRWCPQYDFVKTVGVGQDIQIEYEVTLPQDWYKILHQNRSVFWVVSRTLFISFKKTI
jgi:hypothetical protein